jgi:ABC-type transport system involved in Fe-S cluster assembly fused permease/ATPase subunit
MPAGTRSIQMLYRAVLFTFAPTFIELIFVVGLLANRFSPMVALLVGCTFALYVAWTLSMTQVRGCGCITHAHSSIFQAFHSCNVLDVCSAPLPCSGLGDV